LIIGLACAAISAVVSQKPLSFSTTTGVTSVTASTACSAVSTALSLTSSEVSTTSLI